MNQSGRLGACTFHTPPGLIDQRVNVALVGCGSTGSVLLADLVSLDSELRALDHPEGLQVTAFDSDTISPTNVGRQAGSWRSDIGANKAVALVSRYNLSHGLSWHATPQSLTIADFGVLAQSDIIITCNDSAAFRVALGDYGRTHASDTLWLDTGNGCDDGQDYGQVVLGHLSHGANTPLRLPNVLDLNPDLRMIDDASIALPSLPIERIVANFALALLWGLLHEGQLSHHGVLINLAMMKTVPMGIDPAVWAEVGYPGSGG